MIHKETGKLSVGLLLQMTLAIFHFELVMAKDEKRLEEEEEYFWSEGALKK